MSLEPHDLDAISAITLDDYQRNAEGFREGTRDHDVSQNIEALLRHLGPGGPFDILDFGCGPGRDLQTFRRLGHRPVGLDGTARFVEMARTDAGCEVWQQNFLALELPAERFDGVFANASLFHVPLQGCRVYWASCTPPCGRVACCSAPIHGGRTRKAGTASATAPGTTTRAGVSCWRRRASRRWSTITGRRGCPASSSPGWRVCGGSRPEQRLFAWHKKAPMAGAEERTVVRCQARAGRAPILPWQ